MVCVGVESAHFGDTAATPASPGRDEIRRKCCTLRNDKSELLAARSESKATIRKRHFYFMENKRLMASSKCALLLLLFYSASFLEGQASASQQSSPPVNQQPANSKIPTLFIVGDSTVRNGNGDGSNGQWGWGDLISEYFDPAKINVVNRALGGRSSRTFITQGHWEQVVNSLRPGDFVMIQFGHNDGGPLNDDSRARGSIRGTGDETEEIDNQLTKQHETVHTYGWYLRKYIADTQAKGATPILCSMVPRKLWKDGKIIRNTSDYAGWAEEIARSTRITFLDLNNIIADRYEEMGAEKVNPLFADEHTHTTLIGAKLNASLVIAALKRLEKDPLAFYFSRQMLNQNGKVEPSAPPTRKLG